MIKTKQEVEDFLSQFGIKFDVWGIFYLDRDKNEEALKALGITPKARDEIVRQLQSDDYVETLPADFFDEMWVLGETWTAPNSISRLPWDDQTTALYVFRSILRNILSTMHLSKLEV